MKKSLKVLIGLLIAGVGVVAALNALGITNVNFFFEGWWTLFIIVPSAVNLFTRSDKIGSLIGIAIGVLLLLSARGIIEFNMIIKLAVPVIIILIGLRIAFGDFIGKTNKEVAENVKTRDGQLQKHTAVFTSKKVNLAGQEFTGAELVSTFGSIDLDISGSAISGNCAIKAVSVFGSTKIITPQGVNVKMSSNTVFGDTVNRKSSVYPDAPTVFVKCVCVFGEIELI